MVGNWLVKLFLCVLKSSKELLKCPYKFCLLVCHFGHNVQFSASPAALQKLKHTPKHRAQLGRIGMIFSADDSSKSKKKNKNGNFFLIHLNGVLVERIKETTMLSSTAQYYLQYKHCSKLYG